MAADEADALLFSQTHFTEAVNHVRLSGKLLDANHSSGLYMRQRTGRCIGAAFRRYRLVLIRFFHCEEVSLATRQWQGGFCRINAQSVV